MLPLLNYFRNDVAVDLGTAWTRMGVPGAGVVLEEPSIVAVEKSTRKVLARGTAVGHLAKHMEGRTPDALAVVRPIRDGAIADFALCEALLRALLRKLKRPGFRRKPRVLVATPGGSTPVERQAVWTSLLRAGAGTVWMMSAVHAAAIGTGLPLAEPVAGAILNVGAGTTEIAVLSLGDAAARESVRCGGDAMDEALADYVRRHYSLRIGLPAAERLRVELGSAGPLEEEKTAEISGLDAVAGLPRRATITSEEVRQALSDPLEKIVDAVRLTLDRCSPELAADLVENGLLLSGGAAQLAGLSRYFEERIGLPARVAAEPQRAVIRGLLIATENIDRWRRLMKSSDDA